MSKHDTLEVVTICQECGNRYAFHRKKSKRKSAGHVKHLWCFVCEATTPHLEERE